jgi:flavin reductase (DIM6/NTAB) family NADH-FMN oxidoreductase RutF
MINKNHKEKAKMERKSIQIDQLRIQPHDLFHNQWVLLTDGDFSAGQFNTMTIGWGAIGTLWSKPFAFVAVRHSRYTYEFMEKYDSFTLSAFPEDYHKALSLLGTRSGRDGDKIAESGLTPVASEIVAAPSFAEAEIVIECQKNYWNDLNPAHFLDERIHNQYPNRVFHRIYYGEILGVFGTDRYVA